MDKIIKEARSLGENATLGELARDGQRITKTIIAMGGYESISGNFIRIDSNGDSEGNFTAYALKPYNYTKVYVTGSLALFEDEKCLPQGCIVE